MAPLTPVLPGSRRSLRRAVSLDCGLISPFWDDVVWMPAVDVSPYGLFLKTPFPLQVGDEVLVSFATPGVRAATRDMDVFGRVTRASLGRRHWDASAGMGIEFMGLRVDERAELDRSLRGLPPPLPSHRRQRGMEPSTWVDALLSWEEEMDDRTNIFELLVSEDARREETRTSRRNRPTIPAGTRSFGRARRRVRAARR